MASTIPNYTELLHNEIDQTPEEYRPLLLRIVHSPPCVYKFNYLERIMNLTY